MGIWLVMKTASGGERPFPVSDRMTIGRETKCNLRIAVPSVSDRHCEVRIDTRDGGVVRLVDLGSERGTFHNGSRVREAVLAHADTLTVGPVTFQVRIDAPAAASDSSGMDMTRAEPKVIAPGRGGATADSDSTQPGVGA